MALYALSDLHLSFQADKPMDRFGKVWHHHERKILKNCLELVSDKDTLVLGGDHSWGRKLSECEVDLQFISDLPGRKILIRGNHDMFWDAKKTQRLNDLYAGKLYFLQNNFYSYEDYALVGTKGFTFEGPFYVNRQGKITGWDGTAEEHARKLVKREAERLRVSFEAAKSAGFRKYIMFLHYPPTSVIEKTSVFTDMAEKYGAEQVIYGHCHGEERFHDSIQGMFHGVRYRLVSGDYLNFRPVQIL